MFRKLAICTLGLAAGIGVAAVSDNLLRDEPETAAKQDPTEPNEMGVVSESNAADDGSNGPIKSSKVDLKDETSQPDRSRFGISSAADTIHMSGSAKGKEPAELPADKAPMVAKNSPANDVADLSDDSKPESEKASPDKESESKPKSVVVADAARRAEFTAKVEARKKARETATRAAKERAEQMEKQAASDKQKAAADLAETGEQGSPNALAIKKAAAIKAAVAEAASAKTAAEEAKLVAAEQRKEKARQAELAKKKAEAARIAAQQKEAEAKAIAEEKAKKLAEAKAKKRAEAKAKKLAEAKAKAKAAAEAKAIADATARAREAGSIASEKRKAVAAMIEQSKQLESQLNQASEQQTELKTQKESLAKKETELAAELKKLSQQIGAASEKMAKLRADAQAAVTSSKAAEDKLAAVKRSIGQADNIDPKTDPKNQIAAATSPATNAITVRKPVVESVPPAKELDLRGDWTVVSATYDGKPIPETMAQSMKLSVDDSSLTVIHGNRRERSRFKLGEARDDLGSSAHNVDLLSSRPNLPPIAGILKMDEENLTVLWRAPGQPRPVNFEQTDGGRLMVLERATKPAPVSTGN